MRRAAALRTVRAMETVMAGFNAVDWAALALLLFGLASGARRGLSGEMATLVSTIASGFAAWQLSGWARELLLRNADLSPKEATAGGVVIVFLAVYVALWIVRKSLAALMQFNFKGRAERLGGALSGLIRYTVVTGCLLLLATFIPNDTVGKAVGEESVFGRFVLQRVRPLYEDLSRKHGIPLPPQPGETPASADDAVPPVRDVERAPPMAIRDDAAPPDVITNEVPAGMELGPVAR